MFIDLMFEARRRETLRQYLVIHIIQFSIPSSRNVFVLREHRHIYGFLVRDQTP